LFNVGFSSSKWEYYHVIMSLYFSNLKSENLVALFFSRDHNIHVGPITSWQNKRNTDYIFILSRLKKVL
jgi:hypothetical protein